MATFRLSVTTIICVLIVVDTAPNSRRRTQQSRNSETKCIDMTRTLEEGMIRYPTLHPFLVNFTNKAFEDVNFQNEVITTQTHMGTHMDAPRHFNENGITVDQIPIKNLYNIKAVVVDVRNKTKENPEYQFDVTDLEAWETEYGPIPNGSVVLFRSGWGERWPDMKKFLGTDKYDENLVKFPGLGPAAAALLAQRPIVGVGTECISMDPSTDKTKTAHRTILRSPHKQFILENLANLDQLPAKGARVTAFPIKIGKASGAPSRVMGCFRDKSEKSSAPASTSRPSGRSGRRRQH